MIDPAFIEGNWTGTLNYKIGYPRSFRKKILQFSMRLRMENDIIKGECEDDLTKEFLLKPATIEGVIDGNSIHFIKTYPCRIISDESDKLSILANEPAFGIQYNGRLKKKPFSKTIFFKGEWDISGSMIGPDGKALYYTMGGNWNMKKSH